MAIVDAINKVTGGHGATIEEAVKNLSSGGGGSDTVVVTYEISFDEEQGGFTITSCSMSVEDMVEAFISGKQIIAKTHTESGNYRRYYPVSAGVYEDYKEIMFDSVETGDGLIMSSSIASERYNDDGRVDEHKYHYAEYEDPSSRDNQ